jgi:hypothetical protein
VGLTESLPASCGHNQFSGVKSAKFAHYVGATNAPLALPSTINRRNSGLVEAQLDFLNCDKAADWNKDPVEIGEVREESLAAKKESLEDFLSPAGRKAKSHGKHC